MKIILILALAILTLASCHQTIYRHQLDYTVRVAYSNSDVDTIVGQIAVKSEYEEPSLRLVLANNGCLVIRNGLFTIDRLACGVRTYSVVFDSLSTIKNK